jgi:hypothetical protein
VKKEAEPRVKKEPQPRVKKEPEPRVKNEPQPRVKKEPQSRAKEEPQPRIKKETRYLSGYVKQEDEQDYDTVILSGVYRLNVDDSETFLRLRLDNRSHFWWAKFSDGSSNYIIRMSNGSVGQPWEFQWRMHDPDTGRREFRNDCKSNMTLEVNQSGTWLWGTLESMRGGGHLSFQGERLDGPSESGDFQAEWDDISAGAYRNW